VLQGESSSEAAKRLAIVHDVPASACTDQAQADLRRWEDAINALCCYDDHDAFKFSGPTEHTPTAS